MPPGPGIDLGIAAILLASAIKELPSFTSAQDFEAFRELQTKISWLQQDLPISAPSGESAKFLHTLYRWGSYATMEAECLPLLCPPEKRFGAFLLAAELGGSAYYSDALSQLLIYNLQEFPAVQSATPNDAHNPLMYSLQQDLLHFHESCREGLLVNHLSKTQNIPHQALLVNKENSRSKLFDYWALRKDALPAGMFADQIMSCASDRVLRDKQEMLTIASVDVAFDLNSVTLVEIPREADSPTEKSSSLASWRDLSKNHPTNVYSLALYPTTEDIDLDNPATRRAYAALLWSVFTTNARPGVPVDFETTPHAVRTRHARCLE